MMVINFQRQLKARPVFVSIQNRSGKEGEVLIWTFPPLISKPDIVCQVGFTSRSLHSSLLQPQKSYDKNVHMYLFTSVCQDWDPVQPGHLAPTAPRKVQKVT
ncbi:hypothetical protein ILYODFUR_015586 [Ilyodon furcidens]|uniref:Uncharacterized protein n=1 Tax=Ilyodon furcidens TaxID=33524 RepID=A0ABV0V4Y8_9TELE